MLWFKSDIPIIKNRFIYTSDISRGLDLLIDVYRQHYNKGVNAPSSENIQAVANTQAMPKSAGVLQGGEPNVKSEVDVSWDRILKAGNAGRLL